MIKQLFLLISISSNIVGYLQQHSYRIINALDKSPVSYATIQISNRPGAIIASEKGEFLVEISSTDSIEVTCVGFQKLKVAESQIKEKIIELSPQAVKLKPVTIYAQQTNKMALLGSQRKNAKEDELWGAGMKAEFAQQIELPDSGSDYKLNTLILPVKTFSCYSPFLVHIYLHDTLSCLPGEEIYMKKIEMDKDLYKKGRALIDISDENIIVSGRQPFYISISWPPDANTEKGCATHLKMISDTVGKTFTRSLYSKDYSFTLFTDDRPIVSSEKNAVKIHRKLKTFFSVEAEVYKNASNKL